MKPIASALDIFQGENNIVYGFFFLIPTLAMLKINLQNIENLTVTKILQNKCIKALEKRFEDFFTLEDRDAIVATYVQWRIYHSVKRDMSRGCQILGGAPNFKGRRYDL